MKPKANRTNHVHLNAMCCSQVAGQHYDVDNISTPVTDTFSICIAFTIMQMRGFVGWVMDGNSALLLGEFKKGDSNVYMDVCKGMQ